MENRAPFSAALGGRGIVVVGGIGKGWSGGASETRQRDQEPLLAALLRVHVRTPQPPPPPPPTR